MEDCNTVEHNCSVLSPRSVNSNRNITVKKILVLQNPIQSSVGIQTARYLFHNDDGGNMRNYDIMIINNDNVNNNDN